MFNSLSDNFELVILPEDDPEIRLYNLNLLDRYGSEGKPIVFARIRAKLTHLSDTPRLSLFIPISLMEQVSLT